MGEASRARIAFAYRHNAGQSPLLQPDAMPEILEPQVSPERRKFRLAVGLGQMDVSNLERLP
jgi:hypothetical protein